MTTPKDKKIEILREEIKELRREVLIEIDLHAEELVRSIKLKKKIAIMTIRENRMRDGLSLAEDSILEYVEATVSPSQFFTRLAYSNKIAHKWLKDFESLKKEMENDIAKDS